MTTTSPLPPHAADPYGPPDGWASLPTPAAVQQGLAPRHASRVDPAAVWTVVVAGLVAVIALVVGLAVTSSDGSAGGQDAVDSVFEGDGSSYVDYYDTYDDSGCYDVFC